MSNPNSGPPKSGYGIRRKNDKGLQSDLAHEQLLRNGYAVLESAVDANGVKEIVESFDRIYHHYTELYGRETLKLINEHNTVRCPMAIEFDVMYSIASNSAVREVIDKTIDGDYVLNQQNLIMNPANQKYNQGEWHRDLPYQHFVSSRPLAINALYCVDDFTLENGASYVLPGSHKHEEFPSSEYVEKYAVQISAPTGSFILMDCMAFHSGGFNLSKKGRRAINQVYSIPHIKQQICFPEVLRDFELKPSQKKFLGFGQEVPQSITAYLEARKRT